MIVIVSRLLLAYIQPALLNVVKIIFIATFAGLFIILQSHAGLFFT
jgi:hypothetical protein